MKHNRVSTLSSIFLGIIMAACNISEQKPTKMITEDCTDCLVVVDSEGNEARAGDNQTIYFTVNGEEKSMGLGHPAKHKGGPDTIHLATTQRDGTLVHAVFIGIDVSPEEAVAKSSEGIAPLPP